MLPAEPRRSLAARAARRIAPPVRSVLDERDQLRRREARLERAFAEERRRVRDLEERLATLEAGSTGDAAEPRYGYLFVVTYGRSGSTLLQGLLNTIPGYLIRGENRAAPYRLWQFHETLTTARNEFGGPSQRTDHDSWYGIDEYRTAEAVARLRRLMLDCVLRPTADTRVLGFKEIRWFQRDWHGYLAFLQQIFPGARFVVNTRDHTAVARSQWWQKMDRDEAMRTLAGYDRQFDEMTALLGERAYRVQYDDYVADIARLAPLWDWLGEPFDRAAVETAMSVRHSF